MTWLDDAIGWIDNRKKDTEELTGAVAEATEATVRPLQEKITDTQKATTEWSRELEDIVLKSGTIPYGILSQPIKDQIDRLKKQSAALSETTYGIISDLKLPEIPEIPVPFDLFGAVKEILGILRKMGDIIINWQRYSKIIFTGLHDYMEEMKRLGRR